MSALNDLLDGLAQMAQTAGIANYTPPYSVSDTGIYMSQMPMGDEASNPGTDRAVVFSAYALNDAVSLPMGQITVQVRTRGLEDPFDVNVLDDQCYQLYQGLTDRTFGSVHVIQMLRKSSLPMGQDSNRRWERSSNYVCDVDLPPTSNRPVGGTY